MRRRFLNRLLGLPVARQNLLFAYFTATLGAEIRAARAEGRYFEGVSDLGGSHVSKVEPKVRAPAVWCLLPCMFYEIASVNYSTISDGITAERLAAAYTCVWRCCCDPGLRKRRGVLIMSCLKA